MWHDRNNRIGRALVACAIALVSVSSCTPDGPESGPPTHPTDRYSVTLEWTAPTTDSVGRPLEDLAGYRLYYTPDPPTEADGVMIEVGAGTLYQVTGLEAGDYLFAVTAVDEIGNESEFSDPLPVEVGP
ncbi:MAG: fibronectin type III domain-containing protein [Gemmatimonadetes bacterium]|nr:fibronectin type III domain-containing protein [Gemmatimonadota bacterium]